METPRPLERYRHFRGGIYQVLCIAEEESTGTPLVVYQALYGSNRIYARPLAEFIGELDPEKYPEARQTHRFERLADSFGATPEAAREAGVKRPGQAKENQEEADVCTSAGCTGNEGEDHLPIEGQIETVLGDGAADTDAGTYQLAQTEESNSSSSNHAEVSAITADEQDEDRLDPLVGQFLDARSARDRMGILRALRPRLTDQLIDTLAMACGLEIEEGPLEQRLADLEGCLATIDRYEADRGRLR